MIIIVCIILSVFMNLPILLRERNKRRFAEAKLRLAKTVTAMEKLMLDGKTCLGQVCHDHVYQDMLASFYADRYSISFNIWTRRGPTQDVEDFRAKLREETDKNTEIGGLIGQYLDAEFAAFRFNRPILALFFTAWVAFCIVGFFMLWKSFITIQRARENWREFYTTAAEYYYAICVAQDRATA